MGGASFGAQAERKEKMASGIINFSDPPRLDFESMKVGDIVETSMGRKIVAMDANGTLVLLPAPSDSAPAQHLLDSKPPETAE